MDGEKWYFLAPLGYSRYLISTHGRIYSLINHIHMTQSPNSYEYLTIDLSNDLGVSNNIVVHRLMARCFLEGFREDDPVLTVDHIDRNRRNNKVTNLRLATRSEQALNANPKERRGRKIHQYDSDKNYIKTWNKIKDTKQDGFKQEGVKKALDRDRPYKNCYWRYDDIDLPGEIWVSTGQAFPEFEPIQVSNCGRVKRDSGDISEGYEDGPYLFTKLKEIITSKYKKRSIHQLVLACFTARNNDLIVIHKDSNRKNNRLDNLEYGTMSNSINTAIRNGKVMTTKGHPKVAVRQLSSTGEFIARFGSIVEAHRVTKAPEQGISDTIRRKQKTSGGFRWEYDV